MFSLQSIAQTQPSSNLLALFFSSTDSVDFINSCGSRRDLKLITSLHGAIAKSGLLSSNLCVANSLLDAYSKCGSLGCAHEVFDQMPKKDIVSWTSLISAYCSNWSPASALSVFLDLLSDENSPTPNEFTVAAVIKSCALLGDEKLSGALHGYVITNAFSADAFVSNSLINMYTKLGLISYAEKFLYGLSCRDVVSWSSLISGCVLAETFEKALVLFSLMLEDNVQPNLVTLLSIIRACSLTGEHQKFGCVHGWVLKLGLDSASALANSLAEMYSKNGFVNEGLKIMTSTGVECLDPDAIAALIHGCAVSGSFSCGEQLHGLLMKSGFFRCVIIENTLIEFYAKNERVSSANTIFNRMESRDIVSWNTMISGFMKNDRAFEALEHLTELHSISRGDLAPDSISILCSIQACSELANLQQGKILHAYSIKSGFNPDIFICNALIDMYAKSGRLDFAKQVFKDADPKDIGSWNSMIQAYGIHGDGHSALNLFTQLQKLGQHTPNAITFTNIISACSHSGLTKEGINCFDMMQTEYNIKPNMDHYGCMVDLLGRSGKLEEAEKFIDNMPIDASSDVWGALLGACGVFDHVEIAERAAEKLAVLEPDCLVWRVALSNVYANARRWVDVGSLRKDMKRGGWTKEAGWSLVEVEGKGRFKFVVGDARHFESERIYEVWRSLKEHSIDVY